MRRPPRLGLVRSIWAARRWRSRRAALPGSSPPGGRRALARRRRARPGSPTAGAVEVVGDGQGRAAVPATVTLVEAAPRWPEPPAGDRRARRREDWPEALRRRPLVEVRGGEPRAGSVALAEVGYFEPWWIQIIKGIVIFAVGLPARAGRAAGRAQAPRPLPAPLRPQPRRPVRRPPADRRHRQARCSRSSSARARRSAGSSRSRRSSRS